MEHREEGKLTNEGRGKKYHSRPSDSKLGGFPQVQPKLLDRFRHEHRTIPGSAFSLFRRCAFTAFVMLFIGLSAYNVAAQSSSYRIVGVARDDVLNLRSGPGESYDIVEGLSPNTSGIEIANTPVWNGNDDWIMVRVGKIEGWTRPKYLHPVNEAAAADLRQPRQSLATPQSGERFPIIFPQWWLKAPMRSWSNQPKPPQSVVLPGFLAAWTKHVYLRDSVVTTTSSGLYPYFRGYPVPVNHFKMTFILTEVPHQKQLENQRSELPSGAKGVEFQGIFTAHGELITTSIVSIHYYVMGEPLSYTGFVNDMGYHGRGWLRDQKTRIHAIFENGATVKEGNFEEVADSRSLELERSYERSQETFLPSLAIAVGAAAIIGKGLGLGAGKVLAEGARIQSDNERRANSAGAYKCPACKGDGRVYDPSAGALQTWHPKCRRCEGTGWLINGGPYNPNR